VLAHPVPSVRPATSARAAALLATLIAALAAPAPAQSSGGASSGAAPAGALPDSIVRRVDAVFAHLDRPGSPGCALGIYRDGTIAYARGYGMANLEHGIPNGPATVFDIGSTSKQFTAASILLLARDGTLSLDDDVRRWFPEMPRYARPVTVRQLLHHTSGLRDYLTLMALRGTNFDGVTTAADALHLIVRQRETNFEPGREHLYSNSGYFLLGQIVERASGKPLPAFAAERIFGPLGMTNTHFHDDHTMIVPRRATGYAPKRGSEGGSGSGGASATSEGGFRIDMSGFEQTGDGAVMTTVEDLLRWVNNFGDPVIGDRAMLDTMHARGVLTTGDTIPYALGVVHGERRGMRTVRHGGAWAGYRADLVRYPDQRTAIACLCNLATAGPSALADRVADIVIPDPPRAAAAGGASPTPGWTPAPASTWSPSAAELAALAGWYRDPATERATRFVVRDGKLVHDRGADGPGLELVPEAPNRFRYQQWPVRLAFEPARNGAPARVVVTEPGDEPVTLESFRPVSLSAAQLAGYAGRYYSEELDATHVVTVRDGKLTVDVGDGDPQPIEPTVADVFTGPDGIVLAFTRDGSRRVTGARIDAGRVRNIGLVKRN
jgi:CubicO group peptidase (beta-lactamase class C family)